MDNKYSGLSLEELLALADQEIEKRDAEDEKILGNEEKSRDAALEESTPPRLLTKILERYKNSENEKAIRSIILNNKSVDVEILRRFANSSSECDKLQVASNPSTPEEILEIIVANTGKFTKDAKGNDIDLSEIFQAVIENSNASEPLKEQARIKLSEES